jgi:hypothetical protein
MLSSVTDAGVPDWMSQAVGPIRTQQVSTQQALADAYPGRAASPNNLVPPSYVDPTQSRPTINVATPALFTKPVAAHEATHLFQNSRNPEFQAGLAKIAPVAGDRAGYDYGGVAGLKAHPLRSIGDYNHAQDALRPHMGRAALAHWDQTKQTLERPIRQLQRVPPPDNSWAERGDSWLRDRGVASDPLERMRGLFVTPKMALDPLAPPEAPSTALGYANPSKLVR